MSPSLARPLVEGILVGLGIAVPVGAIAVLIVDTAARRGFIGAVPAALGAATADLTFAAIAAVAGVAVASILAPLERTFRLGSALVLACIVGYRMARLTRSDRVDRQPHAGHLRTFTAFLALTLVNPLTVTYFAAAVLGMGTASLGPWHAKLSFVLGAFAASAGWQLLLAAIGALLHGRLPRRVGVTTALLGNAFIGLLALRLAFDN